MVAAARGYALAAVDVLVPEHAFGREIEDVHDAITAPRLPVPADLPVLGHAPCGDAGAVRISALHGRELGWIRPPREHLGEEPDVGARAELDRLEGPLGACVVENVERTHAEEIQ